MKVINARRRSGAWGYAEPLEPRRLLAAEISVKLDGVLYDHPNTYGNRVWDFGTVYNSQPRVSKTLEIHNVGDAELLVHGIWAISQFSPIITTSDVPMRFSNSFSYLDSGNDADPISVAPGTHHKVTLTFGIDKFEGRLNSVSLVPGEKLHIYSNDPNEGSSPNDRLEGATWSFNTAGSVLADPSPAPPLEPGQSAEGETNGFTFGEGTIGQLSDVKVFQQAINLPGDGRATLKMESVSGVPSGTYRYRVARDDGDNVASPAELATAIALPNIIDGTLPRSDSLNLTKGRWVVHVQPISGGSLEKLRFSWTLATPEITVREGGNNINNNGTLGFGSVERNAQATKTITIKNDGNSTLNLSQQQVPNGYTLEGLPASLNAGASANVTVRLNTGTAGTFNGQLKIGTNDADENPFTLNLTATVTAPQPPPPPPPAQAPEITLRDGDSNVVSNSSLNFGTIPQNTQSSKSFTLRNDGNATLNLSQQEIPAGFSLEGLPASLAQDATANITVRLNTASAGSFSGALRINTNDADENPFVLNLAGTVEARSTTPVNQAVIDAQWELCGAGNFDGNTTPDLVYRNIVDGRNAIVLRNGTDSLVRLFNQVAKLEWKIQAVGDYDGDGNPDIVWRNQNTGGTDYWVMNGTAVTSMKRFALVVNLDWQVQALADLNADGKNDVIWRNFNTSGNSGNKAGRNSIWFRTDNPIIFDYRALPFPPAFDWEIDGPLDANGDGKPDLVLRQRSTGKNVIWILNGRNLAQTIVLPALNDPALRISAVADNDGDGNADLFLRDTAGNRNVLWLLDGTTRKAVGTF